MEKSRGTRKILTLPGKINLVPNTAVHRRDTPGIQVIEHDGDHTTSAQQRLGIYTGIRVGL